MKEIENILPLVEMNLSIILLFLISYHLSIVSSFSSISINDLKRKTPKISTKVFSLPSTIYQDASVSAFGLIASYGWLKIWIGLANSGKIDPKLSRKIIHCGSAPLFMCLWPLYSQDPSARVFATIVPLLQTVRLSLAGLKKEEQIDPETNVKVEKSSDALANAISRSGDMKEALGGPLIYAIVLTICTFAFFRESPIGVLAISQMAAGDGLADIVGRRWGSLKWPFSEKKSYVGSLAFVLGAFLISFFLLYLYHATGVSSFNILTPSNIQILLLISLLSAAVELIPLGDDNVTVPLAAGVFAYLLYHDQW